MSSLMFPLTVVDDFLDQPHKYVELSKQLQYDVDPEGKWPGERTNNLSFIYPEMVDRIAKKIFSLYYNFDTTHDYVKWKNLYCGFQKVNSRFLNGWVHCDSPDFITAIIYFCESGLGTSLCLPKKIESFSSLKHTEEKNKSFIDNQNIKNYDSFKLSNNNQFEKTITVDSKFNRILIFESHNFHCADNFTNSEDNTDRLTMILFFSGLQTNFYPIQRSKSI